MTDRHADERDRKRRKAQHGMRVSGQSTKTVLLRIANENKPKKKPRKR